MPTYRCRKCRKTTEWLDETPCGEDCHSEFQSVVTIHYHEAQRTGVKDILCNGVNPLEQNLRSTTVFAAATCPRCIEKYLAQVEGSEGSDRMSEDETLRQDT